MHIDILVPKAIVGFDAQKPVGDSNAGGGMGIKYARVEEALLHRYPSVSRISRLDKVTADVVMIDPTLFVWGTTVPTVAELQELEIPFSLLSCEEQTIMGLPNRNRHNPRHLLRRVKEMLRHRVTEELRLINARCTIQC